jgi:3-isopropylmalate dehydratase small subunit
MNGWDDIALTLRHQSDISAYEKRQAAQASWL